MTTKEDGMSNELERVARALFEWDIHEHSDPKPTWDDSEGMREIFMSGATVAIAAMTPAPDVGVLAEVRAFATQSAISARGSGTSEAERRWLDLLIILERAEGK